MSLSFLLRTRCGILLVLACLGTASCQHQTAEKPAEKQTQNLVTSAGSQAVPHTTRPPAPPRSAPAGSACAKRLDEYARVAVAFAAVAGRVARFPTDRNVMTEYSVTATRLVSLQEAAEKQKEYGCESDSAFMRRYLSIAAAISKIASAHAAQGKTTSR